MSLPKPVLDDRTFAQLVDEGTAQINRLAPGWTDYNASDPGITLLELFAWLSEQNLYRADRVPDEMLRAFLRLIGIEPRPAQVATTVVAMSSTATQGIALPSRVQVGDPTGPAGFETTAALVVSPAHLVQLLVRAPTLVDVTAANGAPRNPRVAAAALGFAPFGDDPQPGCALYLGFDRALGAVGDPVTLHVWTLTPVADAATRSALLTEAAAATKRARNDCPHGSAHHVAAWRRHYAVRSVWEFYDDSGAWRTLPGLIDKTRALTLSGFVRFRIPADHALGGGPGAHWFIRCRIVSGRFECAPRLDQIALNAATVMHATTIDPPEALGASRGRASESYALARAPVVSGTMRLILTSSTAHDDRWHEAATWDLVGAHDRRYRLDPERGMIISGNGLRGAVFPAGWRLAATYRVGGGVAGNVPAGALDGGLPTSFRNQTRIPSFGAAQAALSLAQPYAATGGAAAEGLADAEARAVIALTAPTKAVTLGDLETLARAVPGAPVAAAKALANHHPRLPCAAAAGSITLIVVPDCPGPAPLPQPGLLDAVARYLHPRRPVTTELHVIAPTYVTVTVAATLQADAGPNPVNLRARVQQALDAFFNPLHGGPDRRGWPIGRAVYRTEVMAILAGLPGVKTVGALTLQAGADAATCDNLIVCPSDLIRSGRHAIQVAITGATIFKRSKERECP
jgi:predicted phage baseplate assembly protein